MNTDTESDAVVIWHGGLKDPVRVGTKPDRAAKLPQERARRVGRVGAVETRARVLAALCRATEPLTKEVIRQQIDTAESTTNDAIGVLMRQGLIESPGMTPKPSRYSNGRKLFKVTEAGRRSAAR